MATARAGRRSSAGRSGNSPASYPRAPGEKAIERLTRAHSLDALAAANLVAYLAEQAAATGEVPSDRAIVVERYLDEIGDWRGCGLSPLGAPVPPPRGRAARWRRRGL